MSLAITMITALSLQIITYFLLLTTTTSSPHGFTIDLTERRTKPSSLGPSNSTDGGSPYSDVIFDKVAYLMKLEIGTPPVVMEGLLDTGSDVIWTQCLPCVSCYDQEIPIFDPSKSSTYKQKNTYAIVYKDTSYSKGTIATETVTLPSTSGQPFVMPETIIGCGHNNSVQYATKHAQVTGVVGLNWGAPSLISQMGEDSLGLFSYCLSSKETSKINFGGNAIVAGGTVATNIFRKMDNPNFYYLNLDAVSADGNKVETLGTEFHSLEGNMIIDSGSTLTSLPEPFCSQVNDVVEILMSSTSAPRFSSQGLCYNTYDIEIFPVITMHFSGGADLVLEKRNMFVEVMDGVYCLAIICAEPRETAIFGNLAHNDFLVGYDLSSQLISFKPTNCSALWS